MSVNETAIEGSAERTEPAVPRAALFALASAALLAVLDGTVVATALTQLAGSFRTSIGSIAWVTVVYLLAVAVVLPTLSWATERFGGRRVFLTGLIVFLLGSLACALAPSVGALIAARALQGLGGGLLEPMSLTLGAALAPKAVVGKVLSLFSAVINAAPIVGPVIGGLLLSTGHWQLIFWVNLPIGALVLVATLRWVRPDRPEQGGPRPPVDARGVGLLAIGYAAVLLAVSRIGRPGPIWWSVVAGVVGAVLLAGYVRYALRRDKPAFDLRLLRRPGFAACLFTMAGVGFVMYGLLSSLPLFGAERFGLHGAGQGLLVTALGVGLLASMSQSGRISDRTGPRPLVRTGAIGAGAGIAVLALVHASAPLPVVLVLLALIGGSFGFVAAPAFAGVYRILPVPEQPQGTTALFMTVQLTASLGVTVLGVLRGTAGHGWLTALDLVLAAILAGVALGSMRLPGAPTPE